MDGVVVKRRYLPGGTTTGWCSWRAERRLRRDRFAWVRERVTRLGRPSMPRGFSICQISHPRLEGMIVRAYCSVDALESSYCCVESCTSIVLHFHASLNPSLVLFDSRSLQRENRTVGFPWSEASVKRSLSSVGGTVGEWHRAEEGT